MSHDADDFVNFCKRYDVPVQKYLFHHKRMWKALAELVPYEFRVEFCLLVLNSLGEDAPMVTYCVGGNKKRIRKMVSMFFSGAGGLHMFGWFGELLREVREGKIRIRGLNINAPPLPENEAAITEKFRQEFLKGLQNAQ